MRKVYICDGIRTPIGRFGGALASVRPDDLLAHVIDALMQRNTQLTGDDVDDVIAGCANQAGEDNRNVAKMSALLAGLPSSVAGMTVNRLCASGLDAIATAARTIAFGDAEVMIAGGVESMSRAPFVMPKATHAYSRKAEIFDTTLGWRFINPKLHQQYGTDSMPETGENVALKFKVSREDQDFFAYRSQQKSAVAQKQGVFAEEIAPVTIPQRKGDDITVSTDEHPRASTTLEKLAQLKTPFRQNGTVTAGNASGVNDGACALLVASEEAVKKYALQPLAEFVGANVAGVDPEVMGIGPVPATKQLLKRYGLTTDDLAVIELNEAFASQGLAVLRMLGVDDDDPRVNPNGGAIALGHPLGMSGARLALSAIRQLHRIKGEYALCTMCIGVGQGMALLLKRV
ncbi:3-oxoadipyl-CoA thiolase [Marinicella sp. S1101]|uniref:3-oxoadipyl-CoA thiolase n=1 Tax=Marinicella marina TaxID=2996016 RepID=UPI002260B26D|nr:3-oxoadipyl-CoA thiolase [Marinicella marina]MCX7554089.1 3-oxoadipyl-CoA thiolase [Marinicella marina]MDJ1141218.1 3-oxoadipyl-CoA thiolase [Marinicella marina]